MFADWTTDLYLGSVGDVRRDDGAPEGGNELRPGIDGHEGGGELLVKCSINQLHMADIPSGCIRFNQTHLWPSKACVIRNFQSVCKTNNLIGQTSKAHQSKQSDWSNFTHCAPRLGEIEINFRFRATTLPFLKC